MDNDVIDCNIIGVDWEEMCPLMNYFESSRNTIEVGNYVGKMFSEMLINSLDVNPTDIHFIGHSLGAHVGGHFGRTVEKEGSKGKIGRLTGNTYLLRVHIKLFRLIFIIISYIYHPIS